MESPNKQTEGTYIAVGGGAGEVEAVLGGALLLVSVLGMWVVWLIWLLFISVFGGGCCGGVVIMWWW